MANNDQMDLFSFFGGSNSFASPSTPAPAAEPKAEQPTSAPAAIEPNQNTETKTITAESDACETENGSNKVIHLASARLREQRQPDKDKERPADDCEPDSEDEDTEESANVEENDDLADDEADALADDADQDEADADKAELAGGQANTGVKADDKTAKTDLTTTTKKEEKKPEFNHATYICYAGHNLSITKLFSEEALAGLDLEGVRKRLEKDFPELSKQRTKMEWDEKKNIVIPMVTGGKKGAFFSSGLKGFFFRSKDLFENKEPVNILAAQNGYYEVRENAIGVFVSKAPFVEELEPCHEGFKLSLPKIPLNLFSQLVSFFADYALNEVEVMGVFYWDTENNRYLLDVPYQDVSKVKVDACYSEFPSHIIKVAEIHSHNTMDAYFSVVDDADEQATMLFGVVGHLQKGVEQITFNVRTRAGVSGRFIPLDPQVFIEGYYPGLAVTSFSPEAYPEKWHERVRIVNPLGLEVIQND
jgi:PRTRC genetic system protein A